MFQPRLGASLQTLSPELDSALFQALESSSIATVEIAASFFGRPDDPDRKTALRQALERSGIRPASVHALFGSQYDFSATDPGVAETALQEARGAVDLAVELDAPLVVFHASAEPIADPDRPRRLEQARQALARLTEYALPRGRRLAVELLPRTCLGRTVEELEALLEGLDPAAAGVCLDVNHGMDRVASLPRDIRALGDRLITTHLSYYDGVDEKHWVPGRGVIDWAAVLAALDEIDYSGPFNYECTPDGDTPEERIACLEKNFTWLSGLLH